MSPPLRARPLTPQLKAAFGSFGITQIYIFQSEDPLEVYLDNGIEMSKNTEKIC
jgi:hypothetical protein